MGGSSFTAVQWAARYRISLEKDYPYWGNPQVAQFSPGYSITLQAVFLWWHIIKNLVTYLLFINKAFETCIER